MGGHLALSQLNGLGFVDPHGRLYPVGEVDEGGL